MNCRNIGLAAVAAAVFLQLSCASTALPPGGERVRITEDPNQVKECQAVGEVEAKGPYKEPDEWKRRFQNQGLALGADTVLLKDWSIGSQRFVGTAFRCGRMPAPSPPAAAASPTSPPTAPVVNPTPPPPSPPPVPAVPPAAPNALAAAQPTPPPAPCSGPEWSQLDFWVGEWDLTWPAAGQNPAGAGTNKITKILGGCVVEENFHGGGPQPLVGMSVSTYSPQAKEWRQTWVDDQGSYLDFTGGPENGAMTLSMERPGPDGKPVMMRMVFKNIRSDSLDWSWERSTDGGKTWIVQWPIHYTRKKA